VLTFKIQAVVVPCLLWQHWQHVRLVTQQIQVTCTAQRLEAQASKHPSRSAPRCWPLEAAGEHVSINVLCEAPACLQLAVITCSS
jgi:hypothetical protein